MWPPTVGLYAPVSVTHDGRHERDRSPLIFWTFVWTLSRHRGHLAADVESASRAAEIVPCPLPIATTATSSRMHTAEALRRLTQRQHPGTRQLCGERRTVRLDSGARCAGSIRRVEAACQLDRVVATEVEILTVEHHHAVGRCGTVAPITDRGLAGAGDIALSLLLLPTSGSTPADRRRWQGTSSCPPGPYGPVSPAGRPKRLRVQAVQVV